MGFVKGLCKPERGSHKGENGRLLIYGGSREYHGAAMLSILAARRFVDLVYLYPPDNDPHLISAIKSIPEVIVISSLKDVEGMDCALIGVGLGKAKLSARVLDAKKLVIDGDGLKKIKGRIPKGALLTPHEGEFQMLFGKEGTERDVMDMAKKHSCMILKKGQADIISDGKRVERIRGGNPGMTKGGTGDVLAGLVAALACKNGIFEAACAASWITKKAGDMLMEEYGYDFCASDLAQSLAKVRI